MKPYNHIIAETGFFCATFVQQTKGRRKTDLVIEDKNHTPKNVYSENNTGEDNFARGLCLPSDNKMTEEQQNKIIEVIRRCFE